VNGGDSTVSVKSTSSGSLVGDIALAITLPLDAAALAASIAVNPGTNTAYVVETGAA
jgi:hypothetical protein